MSFRSWALRKSRKSGKTDPRAGIFWWAFFISLICGAIEFGQPLEDVIQAVRDEVRQQPAGKDIVVVGVDDRTAADLGAWNFPRTIDGQVIDTLFALGARRVFLDRTFSDPTTPNEDAAFAAALRRHSGRVFLGAMRPKDPVNREYFEIIPRPEFLKATGVTSLNGKKAPFGITARLPFRGMMNGRSIPSMSSELAGRTIADDSFYRPDWSIRIRTIPTISYVDVFRGTISREQISGKDVVIGSSMGASGDFHRILMQGWMPGVYFHVVGAETLKRGIPVNWGWMPAFAVSLTLSLFNLFSRKNLFVILSFGGAVVLLGALPLYLDSRLISVDIVPGTMLFLIIAYRAMTLRRVQMSSQTNLISGLPNLVALRQAGDSRAATLIALKMRNYAEIAASFDQNVERILVEEVGRRISLSGDGDEFYHGEDTLLWFTPTPMGEELAHHLEGLKALISATLIISGREVDVSVAFGVDADKERPISSRIGSAMLCAEEAARGNDIWKFYDPERQHEAAWQLSLLSRLDQAIDQGEVWVAYQPKLTLSTHQIDGAEALVRWDHPERGRIDPEEFIAVAEKHNRIEKLTAFVLDQAVRSAAELNAQGFDFNIAVNLSVQLLEKPNLLTFVDEVLKRHGLPPEKLTLEITETGKLDRHGPSVSMMESLVAHGIHVSIDDYGTGNATLDYLKILPSDEVKIDRQFIATIDSNDKDRILVNSTIEMVHSLGRQVVAEGVETQSVLDALTKLGCDKAQGYLIGSPIPFADFAAQIMRQPKSKTMVN